MDSQEDMWSSPYDELSFRSEKYAAACAQLHLAGKNISRLRDFTGFVSLEVLWLNHNRLSSLSGLEDNFRLKILYLHNNRFRTFDEGIVHCFTFLQQLSLNDNFLDDLNGTINELKQLNYLKVLDLFNNPIAQEDNYRLRVIGDLETLEILDRHEITEEERQAAREFKEKSKKLDNFSFKRVVKPTIEEIEEKKRYKAECERLLALLKRFAKDSRLFIEKDCMVVDKRDLGIIDETTFCNIMNKYGCFDILSDKERDFILTEFRETNFQVDSISKTGTLPRNNVINYRKFCQRALVKELRSHDDPYKFEPVPEVSIVSKDLESYVNGVKARINKEERMKRNSMVKSTHQGTVREEFKSEEGASKLNTSNGLSAWIMATVLKQIRLWEKDGKGVAREQLDELLKAIIKLGFIPVKGVEPMLTEIFSDSSGNALDTIDIQSIKDRFQIPRKISIPKGTSIANVVLNSDKLPEFIMFRPLVKQEVKKLQEKCFEQADKNFQSLIRVGNSNDDEYKSLFSESMKASLHGTRLAATKLLPNSPPKKWHPQEIISSAPARSDVVVIPNLNVHMEAELAAQLAKAKMDAPGNKTASRPNSAFDSTSWGQTFNRLGAADIYLDRALERKRRSHAKSQSSLAVLTSAASTPSGSHGASGTSSGAEKDAFGSTKKRVSVLDMMKGAPAPGWAPSTGTIVYS